MMLTGFFQNGYVVRNIDDAMAGLEQRHGPLAFTVLEPQVAAQTPEGFGLVHVKVALAWIGGLQIELIEPVAGYVRHYADVLDGGDAIRHHHIGLRVEDWEATRDALHREGAPIVYEGEFGNVKFVYIDARATLGHHIEYLWATPDGWRMLGWSDNPA